MYFHKDGYPEVDELVVCTVNNVQYNSVFVRLDDYGKNGLIHISEVSPGRIRNIRDFVKPGKVVVCKVLRVNEERGHIDVSLRRVNEAQRRLKLEERKAEQKAEKIVETLARELGEDPRKVYDVVSKPLLKHYEMLNYAFSDVVDNDVSLEELGLDKKYAVPLTKLIIERIKPSQVSIVGVVKISSYDSDGVSIIKNALLAADSVSDNLKISYLGAGAWRLMVVAPDYKGAESIMKQAVEAINSSLKSSDSVFSFERKD